MIDLRSDTVTLPTPAMREAMYHAEVGDDVYHEDPTINRLQEMAAERLGKEAALFVASGTMGNAAAVLAHAGRAEAVIVGNQSHIYHYEVGGASTLGGSPMVVVPTHPDGMLDLHEVQIGISDGSDEHTAPTAVLCIENTHNRCGGTVFNVDRVITNMLLFSVRNAQQEPLNEAQTMQFLEKAREHGVLIGHIGEGKIRAVTHDGIDAGDITTALMGIRRALIDLQL